LTPQGSEESEEGVGPSAIVDFSGEEVWSLGARVPSCPRITALANDPIQPPPMVSYCSWVHMEIASAPCTHACMLDLILISISLY
jgi:hypothetical protein